jgi:N-succinyldiaminopimelate aminotransferase
VNPRLAALHAYPFERLAQLKAGVTPPANLAHIALSIGEPRHPAPAFIAETLIKALHTLGSYPVSLGLPELRSAAAQWLERRFALRPGCIDIERMVLPVNGTREALFAFVQAAVDATRTPIVAMPNPFYQIYEGAALLAGAEPYYLPTTRATRYLPDLDAVPAKVWQRCQVLFLCSPGNPTGAVMSLQYLQQALALAEKYDFVIASDECYADIYLDDANPPPSLLAAAQASGHSQFERCIVFHSLSKRSSVPGLRSGFVAGDPALLGPFRLYRTYHGCAVAVHTQLASVAAWNDDAHVAVNRALYREKFAAVLPILAPVLAVDPPEASFYLWPDVGGDDEAFVRNLYAAKNVTALPGSYLARDSAAGNPGRHRVRLSLVAELAECVTAAQRIRDFVQTHS